MVQLKPVHGLGGSFRGHPRIGDDPVKLKEKFSTTSDWALGEQSKAMATANAETLTELGEMNLKYEEKFGRILSYALLESRRSLF